MSQKVTHGPFRGRVTLTQEQILEAIGITTNDDVEIGRIHFEDGKVEVDISASEPFVPTYDDRGYHLYHCSPSRLAPESVEAPLKKAAQLQLENLVHEAQEKFQGHTIDAKLSSDIKQEIWLGVRWLIAQGLFLDGSVEFVEHGNGYIRMTFTLLTEEGQLRHIYDMPYRSNAVVNGDFDMWTRGTRFADLNWRAEAEI